MKILIVRLSSIGDIILTSPFIRAVRAQYPDAQIDFIATNKFADILEFNPWIDNILKYDKSWDLKGVAEFKKSLIDSNGKYDIIFDLQNNLRSKILSGGLGKKIYKYPKNRTRKLSLVNFKKDITASESLPIPLLYFKAGESSNIKDDGLGLELWLSSDNKNNYFKNKTKNSGNKIITIAPGSKHFTKRYPIEKFLLAIDLINQKNEFGGIEFRIIGGKEDAELGEYLCKNSTANIQNMCGTTSILGSAGIIDKSDLLITNDSMAQHIACARKTPVIALFGSTTLDFGFGPFRSENAVLDVKIKCRPCTHIGRDKCPKRHFDCMNKIESELIAETALQMLTKTP